MMHTSEQKTKEILEKNIIQKSREINGEGEKDR